MRLSARHWTAALLAALLVHAGLIAALLSVPPDEGALAAGVGGIEIGFGPAGGAPGTVDRESADVPEADSNTTTEAADEALPEEAVETVEVEAVEAIEAPMESVPREEPELAETLPEAVEAVVAETLPPAQELPAEEASEAAPTLSVAEPVPLESKVAEPLPAELAEAAPIEEALAAAEPPAQIPTQQAVVAAPAEPPQAASPPEPEEVAASEAPSEAPPPEPEQQVTAEAPVDPPAPRTKPERPQPKPVENKPEPTPQTAEPPKPAEAEPTPPSAEVVAAEAGSTDPSETQTANVDPSMAGDDGKAGSKGRPDVGEGDGTSGGGIRALREAYGARLRAWLQKHKKYPRRAKLRNQEGSPVVQIRIDQDGRVLVTDLKKPSGHRLLDREALKTIERADPMPKPPEELRDTALSFEISLDFVLRN